MQEPRAQASASAKMTDCARKSGEGGGGGGGEHTRYGTRLPAKTPASRELQPGRTQ